MDHNHPLFLSVIRNLIANRLPQTIRHYAFTTPITKQKAQVNPITQVKLFMAGDGKAMASQPPARSVKTRDVAAAVHKLFFKVAHLRADKEVLFADAVHRHERRRHGERWGLARREAAVSRNCRHPLKHRFLFLFILCLHVTHFRVLHRGFTFALLIPSLPLTLRFRPILCDISGSTITFFLKGANLIS